MGGWSVEVSFKIKGPKEGMGEIKGIQVDTTKEQALGLQNDLLAVLISRNSKALAKK